MEASSELRGLKMMIVSFIEIFVIHPEHELTITGDIVKSHNSVLTINFQIYPPNCEGRSQDGFV